jgi:hypothetical protein
VQLQSKKNQLGIQDAQRQLQSGEQALANAKATADTLRGQRQSVTERFGQMLPGQQRAVLAAAQAAKEAQRTGRPLARHYLDTLRQFPEYAGGFLREQDTANARRNGVDQFERAFGRDKELAGAEANERKFAAAGGGAVDKFRNEFENAAKDAADENAKAMADTIIPIFQHAMEHMREELDKQLKASVDAMIRKERGQGRVAAG